LERVVLHALEKRPEDRPANADEFRKELMETAERLGFEHAAVTSGPDLAALRSVGTESPSGRLIIDISRLRETRANTLEPNEVTVVSAPLRTLPDRKAAIPPPAPSATKPSFPRVSLPLQS